MKRQFPNLSIITILSCVIISLIIISCSKKDTFIEQAQEPLTAKSMIYDSRWSIASNPDNPIDSIGIIHNLTLEYIANRSKKVHIDSVYSYAKEYYVNERNYSPYFDTWNVSEVMQKLKLNVASLHHEELISFEEIATWYGYENTSESYQTYIRSLFAIMDQVAELCEDNPEDNCIAHLYNYAINNIKELEGSVLSDLELPNSEREQFLRTSSVLRYSIVYWSDVSGNISKMAKGWKNLIVRVADALGVLVGATYCDTFGITAAVASGLADIITDRL